MMGTSNLPPAGLTRDLRSLLDLMQLASDAKRAKNVLDQIEAAHTEIASKMAEIDAREKAAVEAEAKAEKAVAKAEAATNKALTEQGNTANMKALLRQDEEDLKAHKAALDNQAVEQARALTEMEQREARMKADMDAARSELARKAMELDTKLAEVEAIKLSIMDQKAEMNAKLESLRERIKSLAE